MTKQFLSDTRVGSGIHEQADRPVAHIVEAHRREPGPQEQRLEVLREPRPTDREPAFRNEQEGVTDRNEGPLPGLSFEVPPQPIEDERRQRDHARRRLGLRLDPSRRSALVALDLGVDTGTAQGELMATILATFAQFERRLISQRTKDALAIRRSQGVRLGRERVIPTAVFERIRAERAAGATLQSIADGLNRDGVPTTRGGRSWYASTVRRVVGQTAGLNDH
jgi:hypothetical protein